MEHETFFTLLRDPAHWLFEIFLMLLFDGLIGAILWPNFRRYVLHHQGDDKQLVELWKRIKVLETKVGVKREEDK